MPMSAQAQSHDVEEKLKQWRLDGELARKRAMAPGVASREKLIGRSGMDFFSAMLNGELPPPPITASNSFSLISFDYGQIVMQGVPEEKFRNTLGIIHGGWIATILDSALGCAVHTTLAVGRGYATAELKVSYLRPLNESIGLVRAEGRVLSVGNKIAFAEGSLLGPDGKTYAHATSTCSVFSAE